MSEDTVSSNVLKIRTVFRERVALHMIMIGTAYVLLMLLCFIESSLSSETTLLAWFLDYEFDLKIVAVAWLLSNLIVLGFVAASLNDFVADYLSDSK